MFTEADQKMETWLDRLEMLVVRYAHLGIGGEVASMSLEEKRELYVHLRRRADGE